MLCSFRQTTIKYLRSYVCIVKWHSFKCLYMYIMIWTKEMLSYLVICTHVMWKYCATNEKRFHIIIRTKHEENEIFLFVYYVPYIIYALHLYRGDSNSKKKCFNRWWYGSYILMKMMMLSLWTIIYIDLLKGS